MKEELTQILINSGLYEEIQKNKMLLSLIQEFQQEKNYSKEVIIDKLARRIYHRNFPPKRDINPLFDFQLQNIMPFISNLRQIFYENGITWFFQDEPNTFRIDVFSWFSSFLIATLIVKLALNDEGI